MAQIKGIDVSKWNGEIDWKKVKADGVEFVFIRTGYWTNYTDPYFEKNYINAKSAGVKVGAYHYSYALTAVQAKQEAEFMLTLLKGKSFEYPIAYDLENDATQLVLGKKVLTDMAAAFCETIKSAGYTPMLYINTNWRNNYIDMTRITGVYHIWQAHYPPNPAIRPTAIDDKVAVWQHSCTGKVSGINGDVDMNWDYIGLAKQTTTTESGVDLVSKEYDELKKEINTLKSNLDNWTSNSKVKYGYVDKNMPEWAKTTITKLTQKGYLTGNENGNLQLSDDMLRLFVTLDKSGAFNK